MLSNNSFIRHRLLLKTTVLRFLHNQKWDAYELTNPSRHVIHMQLNNPGKRNSMGVAFWKETKDIFQRIQIEPNIRAIVLSGKGKEFSSGMNLIELPNIIAEAAHRDASRCAIKLRRILRDFQEAFDWIERCNKPVVAAIQGACIGSAVDMICAADVRYCSQDAWFQIKEMELGIAADVGTLQRFPRLVGSESLARELIFTARPFDSSEALKCGFVSRVLDTPEKLLTEAISTAQRISELSPIATQTSKKSIIYSRDHGVAEGLRHIADLNQVMLQSQDLAKAIMQSVKKMKAEFDDV